MGWWILEVDPFESKETSRRTFDQDSHRRPCAGLADSERRVTEFCAYRDLVDRVCGKAQGVQGQELRESREIKSSRMEVFDRIEETQAPRDVGSVLSKSFNLGTAAGDRVWVAPNATKHVWEETRGLAFGRGISEEQRLIGLADSVDHATIGNWEKMQHSRGWELIFSKAKSADGNPVLKHARYTGDDGL